MYQFSRDETKTVIAFILFWLLHLILAAFLIIALFTDWPEFLHRTQIVIHP
jgi:hypothetical protein